MEIIANIGALTAAENVGLYSIKRYQKDPDGQKRYYVLGVLIYALLVPWFLMRSLQYEGLGTVNFFWNVASKTIVFLSLVKHMLCFNNF